MVTSAGLTPAIAIAAFPAWTAPVTRPNSLPRLIRWPGWPCPQPQTWTGGRARGRGDDDRDRPVGDQRAVKQAQRLGDPAGPLVVLDRDRVAELSERVPGCPLALCHGDRAELLARGAERRHVPPGGERVVDGDAAEPVSGG